MPVTLWQYVDNGLESEGGLKKLLQQWHTKEGVGTPTIAKRLNEKGFVVEQRTVWRWLKQENIKKKGER